MDQTIRFRVESSQYGDFKFRLPDDALRGGIPTRGIAVEAQLLMDLSGMLSSQFSGERKKQVRSLVGQGQPEPAYSVSGPVERVENYSDDGLHVLEVLVDAGVPIVLWSEASAPHDLRNVKRNFEGRGTLWGDLSWHDGAIFTPVRGIIEQVEERRLEPPSPRSEAIVTLRIDETCTPLRRLTHFPPGQG